MSDANPIFQPRREGLSEEQLLAYLEGALSPEEARAVEELMAEESAEADALEGLHSESPEEIKRLSLHLKTELHRQVRAKSRMPRRAYEGKGVWVAVLIVLMLALVGYAVMHFLAKP